MNGRRPSGLPAIYVVSQRFHLDAISRLHPHELDVRLVVTRPRFLDHASGGFEGALVYDILRARAGDWPDGGERTFDGVGDTVLRELAPYEADAKAMVDRWNWTGASMAAVHHLYLRYAEIWDRYLRRIEPRLVLFHGEPHRGFDWVLYGLCRARGIPTPILSFTHIEDRVFVRGSVEELLSPQEAEPPQRTSDGPVGEIPLVLRPITVGTSQDVVAPASFYMRETIPIERDTSSLRRHLGVRGALAGGQVVARLLELGRAYPATYPNVVPDAPVSHLARKLDNIRVRRLIRRSIGIYEQAASSPDLERPFVYYPLHFQPEATTLPMGGLLHDQINNVRMLATAIPAGWTIVVKEHPQMLKFTKQWPRARGTVFYETLRDTPSVQLAPIDHSSSDLSEKARIVATTTGTAGWEALLKGQFVLVFGYPWYGACPGVRRVGTAAACTAGIEAAAAQDFRNDKVAVQEWVDRFSRTRTFPGGFADDEIAGSSRPREELVAGTADGVMRWVHALVAGAPEHGKQDVH